MTLIGVVTFTVHLLPVIIRRKEGVGFSGRVVDLRQTEMVGQWQSLLIHAGTTNDIVVLVGSTMRKCFL